jgi:hypothetical protein
MKKIIKLLLFISIINLGLIGCSSEKKSDSSSQQGTYLTDFGKEFAEEHSDDERVIDYYETEDIILSTDWDDITKSGDALDKLMTIAKDNNLSEIKDTISEYKERLEKNYLLDDTKLDRLAKSFANYLVAKIYYEENDYQYAMDINVFDYISYCEAKGLTSEKFSDYDGIRFQLYDGEDDAGAVYLDFNNNVYSVYPKLTLLDSVVTNANVDAFTAQTMDEQIDKCVLNILNYVSSALFYPDLNNSELGILLTSDEINELYNVLSTLSYEQLTDIFADAPELYPSFIMVQTDYSVINMDFAWGEIKVSAVYNREFYKEDRYKSFLDYSGNDDDEETSVNQTISSLDEYVDYINGNYSEYTIAWAIYASNSEEPTDQSNVSDNISNNLEQKLFNSINYALSQGANFNCDMSQSDLKEIYESIEDGTFFEDSYFEYVTEYGRDRYNYEMKYDGLTVTMYYDSSTDTYGYDVQEMEE